jgi:hypothetical protein
MPTGEYSCHDLYLAAFLKAHNLPLLRTEREGQRMLFVFIGGKETEQLKTDYLNNASVPVGDYRRCLSDLKTLIFNR